MSHSETDHNSITHLGKRPVKDQAAREEIAQQLNRTMFVEAGAGSGKTTSLVERVKNLLLIEGIGISEIVAITFTDKSAKELLERISFELAELERSELDETSSTRVKQALSEIEQAPIGTIHSFARRLLSTFTFEAGLTPEIEVLDEIENEIEFETRFQAFLSKLLETSPDPFGEKSLAWAMLVAHSQGASLKVLKKAAKALDAAWPFLSKTHTSHSDAAAPQLIPEIAAKNRELLQRSKELASLFESESTAAKRCSKLITFAERLADPLSSNNLFSVLDILKEAPNPHERKPNRKSTTKAPQAKIAHLIELSEEIYREILDVKTRYFQYWIAVLTDALVEFVLEGVEDRRKHGRLSYQDLLGMARELLLGPDSKKVLEQLGQQYSHYLIDEFQDTDPLQIDLIFSLVGATSALAANSQDTMREGSVFFVGDPKQSIYRFRGADLHQFNAVRSRIEPLGGGFVELTTNFRSRAGIVNFVNSVFERLLDRSTQGYSFRALTPHVEEQSGQASVILLGPSEAIPNLIGPIRDQEAKAVVSQIDELMRKRVAIRDRFTNEIRELTESDIAILSPQRAGFDSIIKELDTSPYQYAIGSIISVYKSQEINDVLMALGAIDDPGNEIRVLTALRSPLFGCSDKEIYHYIKDLGCRINFELNPPPIDEENNPVSAALSYLRQKRYSLGSYTVHELIEAIISERHCFEIAQFDKKPQQSRSRYRLLLEEARLWSQKAPRGTLSQYLKWSLSRQEADKAIEELPPPQDAGQIKLMTIHSAKGLEFPVVFLVGITSSNSARSQTLGFSASGEPLLKINSALVSQGFDEWKATDREAQDAEFRRLLYVACTRARDILVISTHRKSVKESISPSGADLIMNTIVEGSIPVSKVASENFSLPVRRREISAAPASYEIQDAEAYYQLAQESICAASISQVITATDDDRVSSPPLTTIDNSEEKGIPNLSRDFKSNNESVIIGNAVHFALSVLDFSALKYYRGDELPENSLSALVMPAVLETCHKNGTEDFFDRVMTLVLAACSSNIVQKAALSRHWKEMYFCSELKGRGILEGYVDLLFEDNNSLHIVDYKTAEFATDWLIDKRVSEYLPQAATYKEAIERVSNRSVGSVTLLFLTNRGALARTIDSSQLVSSLPIQFTPENMYH